MKKNSLIMCLVFINTMAFCQITLEYQYNIWHKVFYLSEIGEDNYKYILSDSTGFSIYNLDHTPYLLNVVPPISLGQAPQYYYVAYISTTLFDCDSSNIEYVITRPDHFSNFYVYRTDGTLLFQKDSVAGYFGIGVFGGSIDVRPIRNTPNGTRLYLSDNKFTGQDSLYIYSLCGTLPMSMREINKENNAVSLFPNPAEGIINFLINSSYQNDNLRILIYNSSVQKVYSSSIEGNNFRLDLKQNQLTPGIYYFDISRGYDLLQTGKFIITK